MQTGRRGWTGASLAAVLLGGALAGCLGGADDEDADGVPGDDGGSATGGTNSARSLMLLHGWHPRAASDYANWAAAQEAWSNWGLDVEQVRWMYYGGDQNTDQDVGEHPAALEDHGHSTHFGGSSAHDGEGLHDSNTPWEHVAYHWAWAVHDMYASRGRCVDAVGHSGGGVVVRYALGAYSQRHEEEYADFPPSLCVTRVVTVGTPHEGTELLRACVDAQCTAGGVGSEFMAKLATEPFVHPEGDGGTMWLLVGSDADELVRPPESSVGMRSELAVMHEARDTMTHVSTLSPPSGPICWYLCRVDDEATAHARVRDPNGTWTASTSSDWPARRIFLSLSESSQE